MLKTITDHTVEADFLTPGAWVLDAGCLGFEFTNILLTMGLKVIALDPGEIQPPPQPGLFFYQAALVGTHTKHFQWKKVEHCPVSSYLVEASSDSVKTYTVQELMQEHQIDKFALVKLDIEGSEYNVLSNWAGLIARQISVEFHLHKWSCFSKSLAEAEMMQNQSYERLIKWYEPKVYSRVKRHPADFANYWDTLFVERENQ